MRGAEAEVVIGETVVKSRISKGYRHSIIDESLRTQRTRAEVRMLERARKAGIRVPAVLLVEGTDIELEYVEGDLVRDVLDDRLAHMIGLVVAKLHKHHLIHGDLTTSNMLVRDGEIVLIDFGLGFVSRKIEDKAVDIHVFKQVLKSKHHATRESAWDAFIKGYNDTKVLERLTHVEKRGKNK